MKDDKHDIKNEVVLYSTDCPCCHVLEKKLTQRGIQFIKNTNTDEMLALGIKQSPVLMVKGILLGFGEAVKWANTYKPEEHE